jgi:hypothetical protein
LSTVIHRWEERMFIIWKITFKALTRGMKCVGGSPVNPDFRPPWMTGAEQKKERWGRIDIFLAENLFIIKKIFIFADIVSSGGCLRNWHLQTRMLRRGGRTGDTIP